MKRIPISPGKNDAVEIDSGMNSVDLVELEKIIRNEEHLPFVLITKNQVNNVWKEINLIISNHNPGLRVCLGNSEGWGEWSDLSFLQFIPDLHDLMINEWHVSDIAPIANLNSLKKLYFQCAFKSTKPDLAPLSRTLG
jgi:hypothetical protein